MENIEHLVEEKLAVILRDNYYLKKTITCRFLRRSFNEHYLVESGTKTYIARVYINDKKHIQCMEDFYFELAFINYLYEKHNSVIPPIKNTNNSSLTLVEIENEQRYIALFPYASGQPLMEPFDNKEQAKEIGEGLANLHLTSNDFKSPYSRIHLNLQTLVKDGIKVLETYTKKYEIGSLSFFQQQIAYYDQQLKRLQPKYHDYGIVHGDPNPSNFYFCERNGITIFDFDHCAYGWRIHDLAVVKLSFSPSVFSDVLESYETVNKLTHTEKQFIDTYCDMLMIKKFGDIIYMLELTNQKEQITYEFIKNAYDFLRQLVFKDDENKK